MSVAGVFNKIYDDMTYNISVDMAGVLDNLGHLILHLGDHGHLVLLGGGGSIPKVTRMVADG